jgi:hypothetical protein
VDASIKGNLAGRRTSMTAAAPFKGTDTGIVGSNPTLGTDICPPLFCICVVLCRERPCDMADHLYEET